MTKLEIIYNYEIRKDDLQNKFGKDIYVVILNDKKRNNKDWSKYLYSGGPGGKIIETNSDKKIIEQLKKLLQKINEGVKKNRISKIYFDKGWSYNLKNYSKDAFRLWDSEWPKLAQKLTKIDVSSSDAGKKDKQKGKDKQTSHFKERHNRNAVLPFNNSKKRKSRNSNSNTENTNNSNNNSSNNSNNSNNEVFKRTKKKRISKAKKARSARRSRKLKRPGLLATMRKRVNQAEIACDRCKHYEKYLKIEPFKNKKYKIAQKFINRLKKAEKMCKGCTTLCKYVKKNIKNPDLRKNQDIFEARYPNLCREKNGAIRAKIITKGLRKKLLDQYKTINK